MKKSFILYNDYKEHISLLSQSEKGDLLDCIFNFTNGEKVSPNGIVAMAFSFIKAQLERDDMSYEKKREINRKNGLKGGRPSKNERLNEKTKETQNNPTVFLESEKSLNDTDTDTDTDTVNDNDNDNIIKKTKSLIDDNWQPKQTIKDNLLKEGYSLEIINRVRLKFIDGIIATNNKWKYKDFDRAFSNWIRKENNNKQQNCSAYQSSYSNDIPL